MKRPVKYGAASLKALGIVVGLGAAAHASLPYLPLIGPPPLRMLAAKKTASFNANWFAPVTSNNVPVAMASNSAPVTITNFAATEAPVKNVAESDPIFSEEADPLFRETFGTSVFTLPTPDLLSITPQMLATYFHPIAFGTNAVNGASFYVGFMPPLLPLPPDKSSHAEYIVK